MSNTAGTGPPETEHPAGFEETLKDFWASRPRRPREGRKLAGVAAGVGHRYGVDPVVIRVALVVTAVLGGIGGTVYLLGWLFLPDERDQVSPIESLVGRGHSSTSTLFVLALCAATFVVSGWSFGGSWFEGGGFIGLGLLGVGLYLLHRHRGHHNHFRYHGLATAAPAAFTHDDVKDGTGSEDDDNAAGTAHHQQPTWDPLAAAPLGWQLPDSTAEPSQPPLPPTERPDPASRRRRSRVGLLAFALALLVAAVGAALNTISDPDRFGWGWFTVSHVTGLVLAVLGTGLLISAFRGGARKLILLVVPLSLLGIVLTVAPVDVLRGGFGEVTHSPTTAGELQSDYEHSAGNLTVNLSELPADEQGEVDVSVGAGKATVLVPSTAQVDYTCATSVGEVDCLGRFDEGVGSPEVRGSSEGAADQHFTLHVTAGVGSVEVHREQ